ncbi:MAG: DUF2147 domain-containing protein [Bacteroidales bacterium]|nr:DUF2147 domain-containing protein [Bacteroidales bacterium]
MKIRSLLIVLMGLVVYPFAQVAAQEVKADDILGIWLNEDKDAHVEIYKEDGKYFGKIIWLKTPIREETGKPKLDRENEDESLRSRPVMGLLLLSDFEFDGDDEWEDGTIYDPKNGKTYKCYMEFEDEADKDNLKVRGYIGFSLLGRTTYWTRVK